MNSVPAKLTQEYSIPNILSFEQDEGGLVSAVVQNRFASARIYLQGAHVTHFQPRGQDPVLWLSSLSSFESGKAIRGGIPICWPWFGDHPEDSAKPAHGFARTSLWQVVETRQTEDGSTLITFSFCHSPETHALWNNDFELQLDVSVGQRLHLSLQVSNRGNRSFTCSQALHSYLHVGDSSRITILGLEGLDYLDKVDGFRRKQQHGPLTLEQETDRIYLKASGTCIIEDPVLQRTVHIDKNGSRTTVVWNPGSEKAATMRDMEASGYRQMLIRM